MVLSNPDNRQYQLAKQQKSPLTEPPPKALPEFLLHGVVWYLSSVGSLHLSYARDGKTFHTEIT
jgi:hypothetical protein